MIPPRFDAPIEHTPPAPDAPKTHKGGRSASQNCEKTRDLGFTASKQIKMYGEHFEVVSDPFEDGDCTAVHVVSKSDQTIRTLRLPVAILVGLSDRFLKKQS